MHNSLVQARKWAKSVRNCVSKLKTWSNNPRCDSERVQMNHVNELLKFSTPPCNEPRHIRLKVGLFSFTSADFIVLCVSAGAECFLPIFL